MLQFPFEMIEPDLTKSFLNYLSLTLGKWKNPALFQRLLSSLECPATNKALCKTLVIRERDGLIHIAKSSNPLFDDRGELLDNLDPKTVGQWVIHIKHMSNELKDQTYCRDMT